MRVRTIYTSVPSCKNARGWFIQLGANMHDFPEDSKFAISSATFHEDKSASYVHTCKIYIRDLNAAFPKVKCTKMAQPAQGQHTWFTRRL